MRRVIIGTLSIILGTILLIDSLPGITGYIISETDGFSLLSFFGFIFLICGFALFILEARENRKVIKVKGTDKRRWVIKIKILFSHRKTKKEGDNKNGEEKSKKKKINF